MPLVLHTSSVTCVGNRYFFDSFFSNINNVVNITSDVLIKDIYLNLVILSLISNNITLSLYAVFKVHIDCFISHYICGTLNGASHI